MAKEQLRQKINKREYDGNFSYLSSSCFYYLDPNDSSQDYNYYGVQSNGIESKNG